MLVILGFGMIAAFMYLIMTKRLTPVAALILIPILFGLAAGGGLDLGKSIITSIKTVAPTACLLFFAIIYFGMMIDVGMFDPLIRLILRFVHNDPVRLAVGTALLTGIVSLDGDGSTTFIIVTSAFLPVYLRLGMSPWVLTCIAATANGILNTVPWGGSTARAAAALKLNPVDIFVPMMPAIAASMAALIGLAYLLGRSERARIGRLEFKSSKTFSGSHKPAFSNAMAGVSAAPVAMGSAAAMPASALGAMQMNVPTKADVTGGTSDDFSVPVSSEGLVLHRPNAKPHLTWLNALLTLGVMTLLVVEIIPSPVVFLLGVAVALVINFPRVAEQSEQIKSHASSIVGVVGMVFAATVLTGVLSGSGMVEAMAKWLVAVIPAAWGPHLAMVTGLVSIPMTFFTSNDAFYFGVLPILAETASHYGISAVEMARAAVVGQPLHQSSPLVPSFLLLAGLAKVELGEHARRTIWRAVAVGLVMLLVGGLTGAYPL
ncbi:CitMHS family transporter [Cupriavidus taiwanensis]|uniref:CitMHS family transporter n=1 Tax=Cupriavidus taiwanensis TaxID=164546 RepID=UPI000E101C84|nr:citrate:proton symporter [Cupriavidus taiwanensis]SOY61658.1 Citrate transporter [Cupriavidus taiwanensis]SOY63082.1 Citrate transporter [Cupriavidus taiwanensis]SOY98152.1 Citrate transporter [Cupriavidus taiwanensis]SOZ77199.1 Citrate transporter [Cupriavidus taiwanensis]SOZ85209.1 Citrate transporter [Cupriavidus taiwanensis]